MSKVFFIDFKNKKLNKVEDSLSEKVAVESKPVNQALKILGESALDLDISLNVEGYMNYPGISRKDKKRVNQAIIAVGTLSEIINLLNDQREVLLEQLEDAGVVTDDAGQATWLPD